MAKTAKKGSETHNQTPSEEKYRQLFDHNPHPMWVYDRNTLAFLDVNDSAIQLYGYSREEFLSMTILDIRPPEDVPALLASLPTLKGRLDHEDLWRHRRKDGAVFQVEVSSHETTYDGKVARIVLAHDVTAKKEMEKALRDSEEKYRLLTQNLPGVVYLCKNDEKYTMLHLNEEVEALTGYPKGEFLSGRMSFVDLFHPSEEKKIREEVDAAIAEKRPFKLTYRVRHQSGEWKWVEDVGLAVFEDGRLLHLEGFCLDITERMLSESALKDAYHFNEEIVSSAGEGIVVYDHELRYMVWNEGMEKLTGVLAEKVLGKSSELFPFLRESGIDKLLQRALKGEASRSPDSPFFIPHSAKSGWVAGTYVPHYDSQGRITGVIGVINDITERKRSEDALRESEARYRLLFERNLAGVYVGNLAARIVDCNEAFAKIFGYSCEEIKKRSASDLYFHPSKYDAFIKDLKNKKNLTNYELLLKNKDGNPVWVLQNVSLIGDGVSGEKMIQGTIMDITEWKQAEERLNYLANYDTLTDLPGRLLFSDRLRQAMIDAGKNHGIVGVMMLDLDRFKMVNDSLGHDAGNLLLRQVAQRLATGLPAGDSVGRLGGDEFTLLVRSGKELQDVADTAKKILSVFEKPFRVENQDLFMTASMGVALFPPDGSTVDALLRCAETAMYNAKGEGRNTYHFFRAEMNVVVLKQLTMETSLRRALERDEFLLHYQPKVSMSTGAIVGTEALIRWKHPDLGLLPPAQFISIAEETGLILPMGEWVMRTACAQNKMWQDAGHTTLRVATNLSVRQFKQKDLVAIVERYLDESGLKAEFLELEITESILMKDTEEALETLRQIQELGVKISVDDFGTGFSSLSYLKLFPIDSLKIDTSFVRDIPDDQNDSAITRAIIQLGHNLRRTVIAEGVETAEQYEFLQNEKCDEIQGFYFSRPLLPVAFEKLLASRSNSVP